MKPNFENAEIVTTYFAMAKKAQVDGYTPVSIAQYQPKGVNFPSLRCLSPSDFCKSLNRQKRYEEFRREYYRATDTDRTIQLVSEFLSETSLTKIALVCWEGNDSLCHRRFARDILNRRISFASPVEEKSFAYSSVF